MHFQELYIINLLLHDSTIIITIIKSSYTCTYPIA